MQQLSLIPGIGKRMTKELKPGAWHLVDFLGYDDQQELVDLTRGWTEKGWFTPTMPNGTPMNHPICGLGWNWKPYEYCPTEREFPLRLYFLAKRAVEAAYGPGAYPDFHPDTAICNWYPPGSSLSLHQDRSEDQELIEAGSPIVTVGLGDTGICRQGNCRDRNGPFDDFEMRSGDVWVMGGPGRQSFHAMLKVLPGTGELKMKSGRMSITIRQAKAKATAPAMPAPELRTEPATMDNLVVGDRVISATRCKGQTGTVVGLVDRPGLDRVVMVQYPVGPAYPHFLEYLSKVLP